MIRDANKWKHAVRAYLASITCVDARIGRVLDALDKSPAASNTIVLLWSDHGWHLGEKQHWHKSTLWEEATRVPLIISVPGYEPGVCDRPVSLIDVYPTLNHLTGLRATGKLDGQSLEPLLRNPNATWSRPAVIEYKRGNVAVRTDRFRYIRYSDGGEELYDHETDSYEWTNLSSDVRLADVKLRLTEWVPQRWAAAARTKKAYQFDPVAFIWTDKETGEVTRGKTTVSDKLHISNREFVVRSPRNNKLFLSAVFAFGCLLYSLATCATAADAPPMNVVLILIDDLGWRDLGCYGSTYYQTPNIDRLAGEGMRFTDGYAACNVCSPTRAAIMTGKYPARLLLTQWLPSGRWSSTKNKMREGRYVSNLALEELTIAEALHTAGYRTAFMGKWHLGTETYYYPEHQGFDLNVAGRDYGAPGSYFYPFEGSWRIPTTGKRLYKKSPLPGKDGDYLVDRLADEAVGFIAEYHAKPFFLMLSHYAVHAPLQGKPEKVSKYESSTVRDPQGKPAYAAMVESIDDSVGRVLQRLRDLKLDQRTLVIFTSDNGGFAKATNNAPLRANKGSNYEGGISRAADHQMARPDKTRQCVCRTCDQH